MNANRFAAMIHWEVGRMAPAATVLLLALSCSDFGQESEEKATIEVPSSVSFGSLTVGDSMDTAVVISNRGDLDLVIYSADLSGPDKGDFKILTPLDSVTVNPSNDTSLDLRFEPDSLGVKSATLTVNSNDPDAGNATINVSGIAVTPVATVTFSNDVQPIFNNDCAFTGCHVSDHVTGLDLTEGNSYLLLVNVTSYGYAPILRVKPFDADNSALWNKIAGVEGYGDRMPLGGTPLPEAKIDLIRTWIEEGAQNN